MHVRVFFYLKHSCNWNPAAYSMLCVSMWVCWLAVTWSEHQYCWSLYCWCYYDEMDVNIMDLIMVSAKHSTSLSLLLSVIVSMENIRNTGEWKQGETSLIAQLCILCLRLLSRFLCRSSKAQKKKTFRKCIILHLEIQLFVVQQWKIWRWTLGLLL